MAGVSELRCRWRSLVVGLLSVALLTLLGWGAWVEYDELTTAAVGKPDEVIREAVGLIRAIALMADKVDWDAAERAALRLIDERARRRDLDAALSLLLSHLGDGHSSYIPARMASELMGGGQVDASPRIAALLPSVDDVPRLALHSYASLDSTAVLASAATLRVLLARAVRDNPCGLILDLTANGGGNMHPVLLGLLPLLPQGALLSFKRRDGIVTHTISDGQMLLSGGMPLIGPLGPDVEPVANVERVAVLIGPGTGSSGEMVAIALKGAPGVRFFGAGTAGVNSANVVLPLSNGGMMALTVATTMDRRGQTYSGSMLPDEGFEAVEGERGAARAASRWVRQGCR